MKSNVRFSAVNLVAAMFACAIIAEAAPSEMTVAQADTTYVPSAAQVKQAILNFWNSVDVPEYNRKVAELNAVLLVCRSSCVEHAGSWYWTQYGPFHTREECAKSSCEGHVGDRDYNQYEAKRKMVQDFFMRSKSFVVSVGETNNYEGNIISYFTARTLGSDETQRAKAIMQYSNGKLEVIEIQ